MKRIFISYAHTPGDRAIARWMAGCLRNAPGIEHVFLDEESLAAGEHLRGSLTTAIRAAHAIVFLVSPSWIERDHTTQELDDVAKADPTGKVIRRIAVFRQPRNSFDLLPAGLSRFVQPIEWLDDEADPYARLWEIYMGVEGREPGEIAKRHENGKAIAAGGGAPPEPFFDDPAADHPSLECGRHREWGKVSADAASLHRLIVIAGARGEGHGHFVLRMERFLSHIPPRSVAHVDWGGGAGTDTRPQHKDDYVECFGRALLPHRSTVSRADIVETLAARASEHNLFVVHPRIESLFDDEQLVAYYRDWIPELLEEAKPRKRLKCIQPIVWSEIGPLSPLARRLAKGGDFVSSPEWLCAREERFALRLIRALRTTAGASSLRPLLEIELERVPLRDVADFCASKNVVDEDRTQILAAAAKAPTSEGLFATIDRCLLVRRRSAAGRAAHGAV